MSNVQVPKAEDLWKGDKPVFDPSKVTVVFVLGGPGAGKFETMEFWVGSRTFAGRHRDSMSPGYSILPFEPDC